MPFFDQYRWQDVADSSVTPSKYPWDWLINGLQLGRVRQTLHFFPLDDAVQPPPIADIEGPSRTVEITEDEGMDSRDTGCESSTLEAGHRVAFGVSKAIDRDGASEACYSPAFILPLVLAALETCVEDDCAIRHADLAHEAKEGRKNSTGYMSGQEMLAKTAQRLCEKGALSLALASLCSRCCSLRQIARDASVHRLQN